MRINPLVHWTASVLAVVSLAACSSTGSPVGAGQQVTSTQAAVSAAPAPSSGAVDPNAPEVVAPGDIPDNQAFVPYTAPDGTFVVKVPEGWSQSTTGSTVIFTDKYNAIAITEASTSTPPSVASVKQQGLVDVSSDPTFVLRDVTTVTRKGGDGVLATYEIASAPNDVTGKRAVLDVERYVFAHAGHEVTLTLSGAKGSDNVDPWRTVTDSLTWK